MKLSEALLVGMTSAIIAAGMLRIANFAGTSELALASQPAYDRVMQTHKLRCAYSSMQPYFANIDPARNVKSGIAYDVIEQMGRILNIEIVWADEVSPQQAADKLHSGADDAMCFPVWPAGDNAAALDFTMPVAYMPIYAYARADDTRFDGDLTKINDGKTTIALIEHGPMQVIANEEFGAAAQSNLPADTDGPRVLLSVTTKKADVALSDPFTGTDFIRSNPDTLKQIPNVPPVRVFGESFAVAKGEEKLRDMMNVALQQMNQSGFLRETLDRHLADHKGLYFYPAKPWE